jgi:hypothetical protein
MLAYECKAKGILYNTAMIMVERNNMGFATLTKLKDIYPQDQIYKEQQMGREDDKQTDRLGWHTNVSTKPKMFFDLSTAVNDEAIIFVSKKLIHEARVYDKNSLHKTKDDPDSTNHFDLLTATAIAYQGRTDLLQHTDLCPTYSPDSENKTNVYGAI